MEYTLLSFNSMDGTLLVSFYDSELDKSFIYNIEIPLVDSKYLDGEELDTYIKTFSPNAQVTRLKDIKNNNLTKPVNTKPITEQDITDPILDVSLEEAKEFALEHVEAQIGRTRSKYISTSFGQENTYNNKLKEATSIINGLSEVTYYLQEEASILGVSREQLANTIIEKDRQWHQEINPKLEALRINAKSNIRKAATNIDVDTALKNYITALLKY